MAAMGGGGHTKMAAVCEAGPVMAAILDWVGVGVGPAKMAAVWGLKE